LNSLNNFQRILDFSNGKNNYDKHALSFRFEGNTSALCLSSISTFNGYGGTILRQSGSLGLKQWHMLTVVLRGTSGYIYLNSVVAKQDLLNHPQIVTRQFNYFGKSPFESDSNLDAILDDIEIYNVALSVDEIKSKYQTALNQGMLKLLTFLRYNIFINSFKGKIQNTCKIPGVNFNFFNFLNFKFINLIIISIPLKLQL
jgi:hypothetical protein